MKRTLTDADVEAIARRLAEIQAEEPRPITGLVDADRVAEELGVEVAWVYANGERLGRMKLGPSYNSPVRFDLQHIRALAASGELSGESPPAPTPPPRPRRRSRRSQTAGSFPLITPRGSA